MWKFFLGACLLTAAILQPHAPARSILGGMGLAGIALWAWGLVSRHRSREQRLGGSNRDRNGRETDT